MYVGFVDAKKAKTEKLMMRTAATSRKSKTHITQ